MASYTVFFPYSEYPYVTETQYSRESRKLPNALEISTRSPNTFGKSLNPFNLQITLKSGRKIKVECAYQGSKVLEDGAQFPELYWGSPRDAALDRRIKGKRPASFKLFNKEYPTEPKHAFFDWLYIIGLCQRKDDVFLKLSQFDGFSDIYYSQRIDPNSQGRAAAKFVAIIENGLIEEETPSREILEILLGNEP